jgi:hypothetical protein
MIKKLLFIAAIVTAGTITAQNLTLNDTNNNSIAGGTHYFYNNSGVILAETKLHVSNSSGSVINFDCTMYEIANMTSSDWQCCFGTSCFTVNNSTAAGQNFFSAPAPAIGSYNDLKIAPFSFGWVTGDWGVWRVTVGNMSTPSDSFSLCCLDYGWKTYW